MPFVVVIAPILYYKYKEDGCTPPSISAPRVPTPSFARTPGGGGLRQDASPPSVLSVQSGVEMHTVGGGGGNDGGEYKWAKSLKTLVDMGFEESQAKQALEDTNGNERDALTKLIES